MKPERSEAYQRSEAWGKTSGGLRGRSEPPNVAEGQRLGNFKDFSPSRCPEIAIPGGFLIGIFINQEISGFLNPRKSQKIF